jgi:16S rRNA (guanine1516-N2)-methyltransferase
VATVADNSIAARLNIVTADACLAMPALKPQPDAVYLDPMFPPKRKKSALAKKEIRILRELVGDDPDAEDLLQISLQIATKRVIVKRHLSAPPLGQTPDKSYSGKLVRYDVYFCSTSRS